MALFKPKEIKRTCSRCGSFRFILRKDQNKKPEGRLMAFCSRQTRGASGTLDSYHLEQARLRELVHCGNCGSTHYTDSSGTGSRLT